VNKPQHSEKKVGFIERTILGTVSVLKETISNEEIAARNGFFQKCDPRIKCLSVALVLISVLLSRSTALLVLVYGCTVLLAMASSIKVFYYLKRTLLFIPLFSLFIIVPAIFNTITPGEPVATFTLWTHSISITRQGVDSAIILFMRIVTSVSLVTLLILTTRSHIILKTLRIFGLPQLFVMTIGMTYRYIYLLLDIIQGTYIAIKSRAGYVTSTKTGQKIVATTMAGLWLKSYRLQSQVYNAMLSRGYTGEPKVLEEFHVRKIDSIILLLALCALIGTVCLNHYFR
jgi:cobalt/nickel transport system permease protein